jgi:hypothetical protein
MTDPTNPTIQFVPTTFSDAVADPGIQFARGVAVVDPLMLRVIAAAMAGLGCPFTLPTALRAGQISQVFMDHLVIECPDEEPVTLDASGRTGGETAPEGDGVGNRIVFSLDLKPAISASSAAVRAEAFAGYDGRTHCGLAVSPATVYDVLGRRVARLPLCAPAGARLDLWCVELPEAALAKAGLYTWAGRIGALTELCLTTAAVDAEPAGPESGDPGTEAAEADGAARESAQTPSSPARVVFPTARVCHSRHLDELVEVNQGTVLDIFEEVATDLDSLAAAAEPDREATPGTDLPTVVFGAAQPVAFWITADDSALPCALTFTTAEAWPEPNQG